MIDWTGIDTVLLDLDGTLLDLHYDNHFWLELVPRRYARRHRLPLSRAREELLARYQAVQGTILWYCIDYWSDQLGLDIAQLKVEVDHLIAVHPHVVEFLDRLRQSGRQTLLVTNAHGRSLELKLDRTRLGCHFDALVCAHDYGMPKEQRGFWQRLQSQHPFDRQRTLLVDDSLPVLRSAADYGIAHLLAVRRPDSRGPLKATDEFDAIDGFDQLLPGC